MSLLQICIYPDPVLRQKARLVKNIDNGIQRLIDDMVETMYHAPGIGLAANQVGRPLSLLVIHIQREESEYGLIVLINPQMVSSRGETTFEEGCLSVPEYYANVTRPEEVVVRGLDRRGEKIEIAAGGLLAIALQHEMDHLEGKLFIDRISPIARDIFKRRWKKKSKEQGEEPLLCLD
ncbi:MAG TPA: peptide deformylase [Deltaproteobacteria bacterium]|nr:peptide deformylase [Deltaproteobacteria bacterium]